MSLLEELVKKGIIDNGQIDKIKNLAKKKHDGNITETLVELGIPEEKILAIKGEYLQIPIKKIDTKEMSFDVLKYIPEDAANHYHFVPIGFKEGVLEVGITDGENTQALDALQFISAKLNIPFKIFLISNDDYKSVIETYKGVSVQVEEALDEFNQEKVINAKSLNESKTLNKEIKNIKSKEETKIVEDAPVIKIVAVMLRNAIEGNASDIHIENTGEKIKVRFRVDGLLHITDISWGRVKHPSELFSVGDEIAVKILSLDIERERVSLGMKQLTEDPWLAATEKYPIGSRVNGTVVSLTDYGAFVELEEGIEGLILRRKHDEFLGRRVPEERPARYDRGRGDFIDGGRFETAAGKQVRRRVDDPLAGLVLFAFA